MTDASLPTNPIVAKSVRILSELASSDESADVEWSNALVSQLSPYLPGPPRCAELLATNSAGPGLRWHADRLADLCLERRDQPVEQARRRYHARMLGHGILPDRNEFRPLVTVLLPVYNRAGPLVEAVQSCVDQTWRPIEILVVDDGSSDDVETALRRFGTQVRVIHKPNGGVASARNVGLRMAQGDFIHFLDSDDLLTPTAIENAVAAFSAVPDADLCYGQGQWIDMRKSPPRTKELHFRNLLNPIRSMIVEFAFAVPTVMIPRWRMLTMPPFEEDLRRSSDWRFWQALGFAEIKAIGIRSLSAHLRRFEHSLQTTPHPEDDSHPVAILRGLRDLIRQPRAWPYAVEYLNVTMDSRSRTWFSKAPSARIKTVLAELTSVLQQSSATCDGSSLSMLPVLAALRGRIGRLRRRGRWSGNSSDSVYEVLIAAISAAIDRAAPISEQDIEFWTREPVAPIGYHRPRDFFASIRRRCPTHATAVADALLRRSRKVPHRRMVRLAARLRPIVGPRIASAAAARWMQLRGR
ncbi:MAG: glycosyltransferase family 2 protein [Dongiaceae bacterium]